MKHKKIKEAQYFLDKMKESANNIEVFEYNLSAFLSASRSILQYSYEEVKNTYKQNWYDGFVGSSSFIKYFKDKRDTNIHFIPIKTLQRHEFSKVLGLSLTATIRTINKDENEAESISNENSSVDSNKSEYKMTMRFKDWNGEEDILELCKKYFDELLCFLNEGVNKKYITA